MQRPDGQASRGGRPDTSALPTFSTSYSEGELPSWYDGSGNLERSVSHDAASSGVGPSRWRRTSASAGSQTMGRSKGRPIPQTMKTSSSVVETSPTLREGKQPARSFIHSSYRPIDPDPKFDKPNNQSDVRKQTAELASLVFSEAGSSFRDRSHIDDGYHTPVEEEDVEEDQYFSDDRDDHDRHYLASESAWSSRPASSGSYDSSVDGRRKPASQSSHLTRLLRDSPSPKSGAESPISQETRINIGGQEAGESSSLMRSAGGEGYGTIEPERSDEEAQYYTKNRAGLRRRVRGVIDDAKHKPGALWSKIDRRHFTKENLWQKGVVEPALAIPAVILGLLLNVLDGLSYGLILFPLGEPMFSELGPDGLSMFYVSCIVSQLVYSFGGSAFKGGVGSEMIEVVPFFHKMAFTILAQVGHDNPKSVLATTILAFSLSSILTGLVFFLLGACRLGSLIGFFPRHILVGCIGGVGWFLVATGLEVTAQLGTIHYNLDTLEKLIDPARLGLWMIPLGLAVILVAIQTRWNHPFIVPGYFLLIPAIFYLVVVCVPELDLDDLREAGWIFELPPAGVPFWHFYTLYDFKETNWKALINTIPAMFALTFFGILHVPINVPALGISTKMDELDVDRELIAHGISNALSGFCGSIQNYLVYTNSLLFIRSGGNSRLAGFLLAVATAGVMVMGPTVIGYIPVMVVGALIFLLGIELLREALYDTWGKVQVLEYLTIVAIVVTMGAWDFVIGILVGIVLACVSYVVNTSQKSAVRASYSGVVARSTVRRNPVQQRFLRHIGHQLHVIKLAGYLFFGTIASVESKVRAMMDDKAFATRPIKYLIVDFWHVTGVDFSAAEGFTRMRRVLQKRGVEMVLSSVSASSESGKALRSVGVWNDGQEVKIFGNLNAALEACENQFLSSFYQAREAIRPPPDQQPQQHQNSKAIDMPSSHNTSHLFPPASFSATHSPRFALLQQAVRTTLTEESQPPINKYQHFAQPLPLILQTFDKLTSKTEDFWFPIVRYFTRLEYPAGHILFRRGDTPEYFYVLESGILRAEYQMEQGRLDECIVAGTTCGELPFFSETVRTATVVAERKVVAWGMDREGWGKLKREEVEIAVELLGICLKLTSERMGAITSYILINA